MRTTTWPRSGSRGANVVSTFGDDGRPGTLTTSLVPGEIHEWMIETIRSGGSTIIRYYWDDMATPKATQKYDGGSGNYFKFGNYHQSTTSRDHQGEPFVLDLYDSEVWHTGYPDPAPRNATSSGGPGSGRPAGPGRVRVRVERRGGRRDADVLRGFRVG